MCAGVNATTVAESTIMMLLMLARRVPETLVSFRTVYPKQTRIANTVESGDNAAQAGSANS